MVLPCLMSGLKSIGGSCFGWAGERIQTEATLLFSYADNLEILGTKVQDLSDTIKAVEHRIEEAANRGETLVVPVVDRLLKRMASLQGEASKLVVAEEQSSDSRCLMGLRPNLWACYVASKLAKKAIDEAVELLEKGNTVDMVVATVDYSKFLGVTPIEEFEEFESRVRVSNQITAALKDTDVNKVGVYGMGGAGKTTLAEKIGAVLQLDSTFSFVVLITVSEKQSQQDNNYKPDLLNIQKQIAGGFKIQLQGKTLRDRAAELREQLQKKDKVLIILDDIWSGFELKDVGIPIGNVDKKFKIFMTSRSEAVLRKEMNSTNNFGLDSLTDPDAWILFDRMVGGHIEYSNWRLIAEQVIKQCGGIPIVLVTIARALRNESLETWEDALTQLKKFDGKDIVKEPYEMIEVSYKFLKNEEIKKLLLLCAQLNHRAIVKDELLKYVMGLNLFEECKTLKEVRNRLHRYLNELKGCCLLQDGNKEGVIKMHDVVHKFASFVACRVHHVFTVADGELQDWPSKDEFERFSAISLPYCRLPPDHMLPATFENPKLESFLMLRNKIDASFQIPDNFFVGMKELKLMDLTRMSLSPVLVSSLSALVKLRTLCLDICELSDISVIGKLPMLQALSLFGSSIVLVPKEIGNLGSTLKLLDLRGCQKLETIEAGVIFRLTLLEDLRIGRNFNRWKQLEGNHKRSNIVDETTEGEMASMEEFKNLQNLIHIEIHIHEHAKMFPKDLVFKKLETFKISFGVESRSEYISTRTLEVNESTTVEFDGEGIKALLTSVESLLLARVMGPVILSETDWKGFPELKHLKVYSTEGIQYIAKKNYNTCIFPKLETLNLFDLAKLVGIGDDHDHLLPVGSFENLRVIDVSFCKLLSRLLPSNLARGILRLKEIRVKNCKSMESIIYSRESENAEEIQIEFTRQLRVLNLDDLPLLSFCSFKQTEGGLPSPTPLFNKKIMFPKLEVLNLKFLNIQKIWDDYLAISTPEMTCWLQNLASLYLFSCNNLRYLFTFSMLKSLTKLKQLEVSYCRSIEEIVASEMEGEKLLMLPKLGFLELHNLPKLKRFCHSNIFECQSLQTLKIKDCPMLKAFNGGNESSLFDEKIMFRKLEVLELRQMKIEKILDADHFATTVEDMGVEWFQNLTSLEVSECHNLRYLFTSSMVKSLVRLKKLEVSKCESFEEIIALSAGDVQLLFPKLDHFVLNCLPKLKAFSSADDSSSSNNSTTLLTEKVAFPNMDKLKIVDCSPGRHSLETLFIKDCPELKTFITTNCSSSSSSSTTLFTQKVAFRNMEELQVADFPSPTSIFPTSIVPATLQQHERIKVMSSLNDCNLDIGDLQLKFQNQGVSLQNLRPGSRVTRNLYNVLRSLPKLNEVEGSHMVVVAEGDGDDMDSQANTLLRTGHSRLAHVIREVAHRNRLLSSTQPSKTWFKNLTGLRVWGCPMLIRVVASSSAAKSLANLKEMGIAECDSLEEIVGIDGDDDQWDELASNKAKCIVFEKLEVLHLLELSNLTSFCSTSDRNFMFPSLNRVSVFNCPKMKFFSMGALSTPDLLRVCPFYVEEEEDGERVQNEGRWEGDLNSTIRRLFEEKVIMVEDEDENVDDDENTNLVDKSRNPESSFRDV